ncbi:MAG: DNA polymerase-3 subunit delta' [Planctomycetota bacterium]
MSSLSAPVGHSEVLSGLWQARSRGRLPHALLFEGPSGIGKYHAALWFIQGVFCESSAAAHFEGPCGTCGPCKRIAAGTHPDFHRLDPLEEELEKIPVSRIAPRDGGGDSVCDFFALRAMEGGMRVVLIRDFERANTQAQNALLKTLEEPGPSALLVLVSGRPDLLLETIRSRCVSVRLDALEKADAELVLRQVGARDEDLTQLVNWAAGSPGKALELQREGARDVRDLIAQVLRGECEALDAAQETLELPGEFDGKTPTAQTRARTRAALELLLDVLRDGLRHQAGSAPADLAHGDLAELSYGKEFLWRAAQKQVVALRGEVELNLSPLGILDRAFLALPQTKAQ